LQPTFLVVAPTYTHRSAGVRALYRLCHHLNAAGYRAAMTPLSDRIDKLPVWFTPLHTGPVGDGLVIYPEIVSGNPLNASKVVRWTLNNPGLLGGDTFYPDDEMVFVFNPTRLGLVSKSVNTPLGPNRILSVALIDPAFIYPDPRVPKTIDCYFVHKGHSLRAKHPLPNEAALQQLEAVTPNMESLGKLLRRTRTLYCYDHASTVLKEAKICGCEVLVMHEDGELRDPETCGCPYNVFWGGRFRENYARGFHDSSFVHTFVAELRTRWDVPDPMHFAGTRRIYLSSVAPVRAAVSRFASIGRATLTRLQRRAEPRLSQSPDPEE
jgi:hypothetical protein